MELVMKKMMNCEAARQVGAIGLMNNCEDTFSGRDKAQRKLMNGPKETIAAHPFFRDMKPEYRDILASGTTEMTFKPGQILFREGDPANQFYLIQSGRIALEAHGPSNGTVVVQRLGVGEVLGWSWLFPPFMWHFQARAEEPTKAIVLSGAHLLVAAERDREFGYELMKRVAQVVIQRLQATRKQLLVEQIQSALEG
jgi:CRP-like cAMP-binding protein